MVRFLILGILLLAALVVFLGPAGPPRLGRGSVIDLRVEAQPGLCTVFTFVSSSCGSSEIVARELERVVGATKGLAHRIADVNRPQTRGFDLQSPLARQFGVMQLPWFVIAGPTGEVSSRGEAAVEQVLKWYIRGTLEPGRVLGGDPEVPYGGPRVAAGVPGEAVDLAKLAVRGRITIIDFYSDHGRSGHVLAGPVEKLVKAVTLLVLRRVDVNRPGVEGIDWDSPVCRALSIRSVPHYVICGEGGQVRLEGVPAQKQILDWVNLYRNTVETRCK